MARADSEARPEIDRIAIIAESDAMPGLAAPVDGAARTTPPATRPEPKGAPADTAQAAAPPSTSTATNVAVDALSGAAAGGMASEACPGR